MLNEFGVDADRIAEFSEFMERAATANSLSLCTICDRHLQLLMLIPCGHMMCADCVEYQVESIGVSCGVCNATFDWEDFQKLQPGAHVTQSDEDWGIQWQRSLPKIGTSLYPRAVGGMVGDPAFARDGNGLVRRVIPFNFLHRATGHSSKAFYVGSRIKELCKEYEQTNATGRLEGVSVGHSSHRLRVVKAIVYSQFQEYITRTKISLAQQGIQCAEFLTSISRTKIAAALRIQNLHKFRLDPHCNVLLLTDVGSRGLDLSFVTHIFLMDEIWDKSLEKQVISRAHRMGAQQSVVVEQLLMRGSIEERLHEMNCRQKQQHVASANDDMQGMSVMSHRQLQHLLRSLRLMRETSVAELGFVKYKVLDNRGELVREATQCLSEPVEPPASANSGNVNDAHQQSTACLNQHPQSSTQQRTTAAPHSDKHLARPSKQLDREAVGVGIGSPLVNGRTHGAFDKLSPVTSKNVVRERARRDVIDLTSDGDSGDEQPSVIIRNSTIHTGNDNPTLRAVENTWTILR